MRDEYLHGILEHSPAEPNCYYFITSWVPSPEKKKTREKRKEENKKRKKIVVSARRFFLYANIISFHSGPGARLRTSDCSTPMPIPRRSAMPSYHSRHMTRYAVRE